MKSLHKELKEMFKKRHELLNLVDKFKADRLEYKRLARNKKARERYLLKKQEQLND